MRGPARRSIINIIALLAAGATLNVAVAWGLAYRAAPFHWSDEELALAEARELLVSLKPASWGECSVTGCGQGSSVGLHQRWVTTDCRAFIGRHETSERPSTVRAVVAGWPFYALSGTATCQFIHQPKRTIHENHWRRAIEIDYDCALPLEPLWPGFAINTLFYAGVLWMLFCGPFALRRMIRRRRGRCSACNYPIGQSPVCTECGAAVKFSGGPVRPATSEETVRRVEDGTRQVMRSNDQA